VERKLEYGIVQMLMVNRF